MGSSEGSATLRAEAVVRRFYDFLARGRLVDARKLGDVPVPSREDPSVSVLEVLQGVAHGVLDVLGVHVLRDRGRNRVHAPDEMDRVGPITQFVEVARL